MQVQQGRSSDILSELYGDVRYYQEILLPYQNKLSQKYPNANIDKFFNNINKKTIAITPMVLCARLMKDLGCEVQDQDLVALGLHMLAISTHDDVVDEMPRDRIQLAALVYAGNIATNEASKVLVNQGKKNASKVLLDAVNSNHFYQQHIAETLWQTQPKSFEDYLDGIHHITTFALLGLIYGLALSNKMEFQKKIEDYAYGYGVAMQLIDDLREMEEDNINGYWSFPLVEGEPFTRSFQEIDSHLQMARNAIPEEWKQLQDLVDRLEKFVNIMCS